MNCPNITPYYRKKIRKNLLAIHARLDKNTIQNGIEWYPKARFFNEKLVTIYGRTLDETTQVTANLSVGSKWERNKFESMQLLSDFTNGENISKRRYATYPAMVQKSTGMLLGLDQYKLKPKSLKTYAFYKNMLLDENFITIDRWHLRACFGKNIESGLTEKRYREIEKITINVAKELGYKGYEFQAVIWEQIRTEN